MESTGERSVCVPNFSGNVKDFQLFWMRFKAFAQVTGFIDAIGHEPDPNLPDSETVAVDASTIDGKKAAKAKRSNGIAMAHLTIAFTSDLLVGIINNSCDRNWPGGLAYKVVELLFGRYVPQDVVAKVELRQAMNAVMLGREDDPVKLFEKLSRIENQIL